MEKSHQWLCTNDTHPGVLFQNQVKTILDQQAEDDSHSDKGSEKSVKNEPVTVHEPTREEVVAATMKELQKIQTSYGETGDMDSAEPSK